jgi:broad specificity phosphatase PhoE
MKLTIIRHGQTQENIDKIIQGQQPGHLTALGKEQAAEAAKKLEGKLFDVIYSSDLQRCLDTSEPIRHAFPNVSFKTDRLLRERFGGSLEGKPLSLVGDHTATGDKYTFHMPDGGESWEDVKRRQVQFLNGLFDLHPEGSVLIVTHRGPVLGIRSALEHRTLADIDLEPAPNAGIWEESMTERLYE